MNGEISQGRGRFSVQLTNGSRYARLIRVYAKWNGEPSDFPDLVLYSDNYFDLLPGETKTVEGELFLPDINTPSASGTLTIEGVNVPATNIRVKLQ